MNTSVINNQKNKKETFSKNNIDDHNFQTATMENKLKNIKKKKSKMKNNFKNIETFSILENEEYEETGQLPETAKKTSTPVENFDNLKSIFTNKIIEGNANLNDKNDRETWEGHDEVSDNEKKKIEWRDEAVYVIEKIYSQFTKVNEVFSKQIADILSDGNATKDDILLIRDYFATIFAALISIPISFNWYYIMYFIPRNQLISLNLSDLKEKSLEEGYDALKLILFIFEFALFFPSMLNSFVLEFIPRYTSDILSGKIKFISVYFATFYGVKNISSKLKQTVIDLIKDSSSNLLINLMFAIVFIKFFISLFSMDFQTLFSFFTSPITFLIKNIIRFIIIIIISVPAGAFFSLLYLFIYSFFAIFIYSKEGVSKGFNDVISHSNADYKFINETCNDDGIFTKILKYIMKIIGMFKNNIFLIILIGIVLIFTIKMNNGLSNASGMISGMSLKDSFMLFNFMFFTVIATWLYIGLADKVKQVFSDSE
jgi:hypothetical protein